MRLGKIPLVDIIDMKVRTGLGATSREMEKPRGSFGRSFHPLGVFLLSRSLSAQLRYLLKPKPQPADRSGPVGSNHWGSSPDFPCGVATFPCGSMSLPDLRDPLRDPGAAAAVSRLND